jgi:dTDP-4-amino-4,6-dideoxygalactose transaminase
MMKELNARGIGATVYYEMPVHKTPYYNKKIKLPVTEWAAKNVLSLPVQPMVTQGQLEITAKTIRSVLA